MDLMAEDHIFMTKQYSKGLGKHLTMSQSI